MQSRTTNLFAFGALAAALAMACLASLQEFVGFDVYWHLRMGVDWVTLGLSPWIDHYSYTFSGEEIRNPPVLFQAALHYAISFFGEPEGFYAIRGLASILMLGTAVALLLRVRAPVLVLALVLSALVYFLQMRIFVRPEIFSYAMSGAAVLLYVRAGTECSPRMVVPMIALMWLWSAYHSPIVGYVIFAGYFLDCAVHQFRVGAPVKTWRTWLLSGLSMIGVSYLVPGFRSALELALVGSEEWASLIGEYYPQQIGTLSLLDVYTLIIVGAPCAVLAVMQRRAGFLLVWGVLTYTAISMSRMITPAGIVVTLLLGVMLAQDPRLKRFRSVGELRGKLAAIGMSVLIAIILLASAMRIQTSAVQNWVSAFAYPTAMAGYMAQTRFTGRIFNEYGIGGFLLHRLYPGVQIFIDGRTQILYPRQHLEAYLDILGSPDALRDSLNEHEVEAIVLKFTRSSERVFQAGNYFLDFVDVTYGLWKRGDGRLAVHGLLSARPACWGPEVVQGVSAERAATFAELHASSALIPFSDLVEGFAGASDGVAFFDTHIDQANWSDDMRRFAAFRLMDLNRDDLAVALFGSVQKKRTRDYLGAALAGIRSGSFTVARAILDEMQQTPWPGRDRASLWLELELLGRIEPEVVLEKSLTDRLTELRSLSPAGQAGPTDIGTQAFCALPGFEEMPDRFFRENP